MRIIYKVVIVIYLVIFPISVNAHVQHYVDLNRIEFDIYRNNKHIGKHVFSFDKSDGQLAVDSEINFKIKDLTSRAKNCLFAKIDKPDDELMFAILLKNFSDRQITIEKKLIEFIIKRIDRSYGKIYEFIYKIDEISLKKKKSIDFKIINEALKG